MNPRILIVDDHASFCRHIAAILQHEGYEVTETNNPYQALEHVASQPFDIILTDMKMPDMNGLELFLMARKSDPLISGIIMTAYGSIESAVAAIKEGVTDYLQKPFEPESLLLAVEKTLRERRMQREIQTLREVLDRKYSFGNIIGKNHKMRQIYDLIEKVALTDTRVFITGETGVGKELVAKAIHFNSNRKSKPFVGINCGALSESLLEAELFGHEKGAFTGAVKTKIGKFEYAKGGTLFLDEIGDISPGMQVKLLRVLQERVFERVGGNSLINMDVRIISATNQNIEAKIRQNDYRVELFYRLNVVPIHIPPLRGRIDDIPLLMKHFISVLNKNLNKDVKYVSPKAMRQLMQHSWPGNVRELENVLERAFVTTDGDTIDTVIFAQSFQKSVRSSYPDTVDVNIPLPVARSLVEKRFEKAYIYEALKRYNGNVSRTAQKVGVNPRTLWRKIKAYGFDPKMLSHKVTA